MNQKRNILFGFEKKDEILIKPLIRECLESGTFEIIRTFDELEGCDASKLVDTVVINVEYIGFLVKDRIRRITEYFPEAFLICIARYTLAPQICHKFAKSGVEVMFANVDSDVEYERVCSAIRKRRPYRPANLRHALDENELSENGGIDIISKKELEALQLTVEGCPLKEIAYKMNVREATVSKMRTNAFKKTGVNSLSQLITLAYEFNIRCPEIS